MTRYLFATYLWIIHRLAIWLSVATVLAAVIGLVSRIVLVPEVKANIEDARINSFALFTSGTASVFEYNISMAIIVHNPVKAMSLTYTEPLVGTVVFNEQPLYNGTFTYVGQKHPRGKVRVHLLYSTGQVPSHVLGGAAVDEYIKRNATGVFFMEVRISGEITFGLGDRHKLSLSCPVSVRVVPVFVELHKVYCVPVNTWKKYS
jgi:hypothetical protein